MEILEKQIWQILEKINDPEIPVLSIIDLGIIRSITFTNTENNTQTEVLINYTPTYSACPAVDMMNAEIRTSLSLAGFKNIRIEQTLFPAWTTDWMTESGKEKLIKYGIAAPMGRSCDNIALQDLKLECPQCGSNQTTLISEFSSTACKALYKCNSCLEPFDYFKCH
jgi:ring-1,2-phenylacetyl-CoA epoxidase subunit PaaD